MGSWFSFLLLPFRTYKMVFVVNKSLKNRSGTVAAQVGHVTLAIYKLVTSTGEGKAQIVMWEISGQRKIVAKAENTEQLMDIVKEANEVGLITYLVQDRDNIPILHESNSVLGVFGSTSIIDKVTGRLKLF